MKATIERYRYIKQVDAAIEVELPDTVEYHFQTGIRRSICVVPVWTTWNEEQYQKDEEIYKYDFICVYRSFENRIERSSIQVSQLSDLLRDEKHHDCLGKFLIDYRDEYTVRTKEQFTKDYNTVLNNINELL